MIRQQLFIGAALLAGVAIGYFIQPEPSQPSEIPSKPVAPHAKRIADEGDAATVVALRARIRDLEAKLASAREDGEGILSNAVERLDVARKQREWRPESPREWRENLRKNDPERFAQISNNVARWQQRRREQQTARANFLATVDPSQLSAEARQTHEAYQELLKRRAAIEERMSNFDLSEEEHREIRDEMFAVEREFRQTSAAERRILLGEVAREVGLQGEDAEALIQTVNDVMDATGGGGAGHRGFHLPPPSRR